MPRRPPPPNVFAGPYLNRMGTRRDDPGLDAAMAGADTQFVLLWQSRNLVSQEADHPQAALLTRERIEGYADRTGAPILLGEFRERLTIAVELEGEEPPVIGPGTEFQDLRTVGGQLPEDEAGLLAYARAMILWRATHRYCGRCGGQTIGQRAGHVLHCTECGTTQFPRIDPAIIVLVTTGEGVDERALLGRQAVWPAGRRSTIAGFVEPGESLEDAVAREVLEETGIEVDSVVYHSSQPWPFPSSLMLGFRARARTTAITCHDGELEAADWFSRADLAAGHVLLPPRQSISYRLIDEWRTEKAEEVGEAWEQGSRS